MGHTIRGLAALAAALAIAGCASMPGMDVSRSEFLQIEQNMGRHIEVLASDEYGGRRPATDGERRTLSYLRNELEQIGFSSGTNDPANPWLAPVALTKSKSVEGSVEFTLGRKRLIVPTSDAFAFTGLRRSLTETADLVMMSSDEGAIHDTDVAGKVVILLSEGGQTGGARNAAFEGGAAAVLVIVEDTSAIEAIRRAMTRERFALAGEEVDELTAFVSLEQMKAIFGEERWNAWTAGLEEGGGEPVAIQATARIEALSEQRGAFSSNLIGRLEGLRPNSGAVLLMAHWDHFGSCGPEDSADRLCNGAVDNASGVALMVELARRLAASGPHDRDIYVLGTTAEEWGLLGAKAFASAPPIPLETITAAFNFDSVAIADLGAPVVFIGQGYTPIDDRILAAIERNGRTLGSQIVADSFLQRQDGWALLEQGVPSVVLTGSLGDESALGRYLTEQYHQADDEVGNLQLRGAVQDLLLHEDLIRELASVRAYPGPVD